MGGRPRFGLDIDGVLYNWDKTARYMLRTYKSYPEDGPLAVESQSWDYIQRNVSKEDWNWLWNTGVKQGLFRYGHLYKGTIEGVRRLAELGDVVVITHRPRAAVQDTLDWLSFLRLPFTETHLLTSGERKSLIKCDLYVDDKPENFSDYFYNTDGVPLLWDRGWNRHVAIPEGRGGLVRSWEEVVEHARKVRG